MAAVLLSIVEGSNETSSNGINPEQVLFSGIIPVLVKKHSIILNDSRNVYCWKPLHVRSEFSLCVVWVN
ncbi:hypothetical protein Bca4012_036067 [Brassica carinata]